MGRSVRRRLRSIMGQIECFQTGPIRTQISGVLRSVIKGVLFALSVAALVATLRVKRSVKSAEAEQRGVAEAERRNSPSDLLPIAEEFSCQGLRRFVGKEARVRIRMGKDLENNPRAEAGQVLPL